MSKIGSKLKEAVAVAKPVKNVFRTTILAQSASASPPLGPLIGHYGLNISNFCKSFNEQTKHIKKGIPLPVTVRIKPDRSFVFNFHTPPVAYYLKQAAGIQKAKIPQDEPGTLSGKITIKHVYEIAKIKYEDPFSKYQIMDFPEVVKKINGIAFLLGIDVVKELDPDEYEVFLKERNEYLENVKKQIEEMYKAKLQRS